MQTGNNHQMHNTQAGKVVPLISQLSFAANTQRHQYATVGHIGGIDAGLYRRAQPPQSSINGRAANATLLKTANRTHCRISLLQQPALVVKPSIVHQPSGPPQTHNKIAFIAGCQLIRLRAIPT